MSLIILSEAQKRWCIKRVGFGKLIASPTSLPWLASLRADGLITGAKTCGSLHCQAWTLTESGYSMLRSALSISLGDIVAAWHYGSECVADYLVNTGRGMDFRRHIADYGLTTVLEYHQDGHPSGLADWRRVGLP
jgi:hypothetical protein